MAGRAAVILHRLEDVPLPWALLGISLVAAVPRLYLGATQFIEYDGYWHVFIAMQDDWQQFRSEYQSNFHPPLFYLLLKLALWLGHTPLVYRAISLLTGTAAVFVTGKIAERVSLRRSTAIVAALAYGLALPSIIMSCEVRSYMLSVFFVLVSFYYFLDVLKPAGEPSWKSRALFAGAAILAVYSHYGAFFYIFACAVASALFDLFPLRRSVWRRLTLDLATFCSIAAALAYVYSTHARPHAVASEHLLSHYFQPGSGESVQMFLFRNGHELVNAFSPIPLGTAGFRFVLAILILGGAWLVYMIRELRRPENAMAAATVLISAVILVSIMASAVMDKYPFGGALRQQFFLFPFTILCGCILLDRLADVVPRPKLALALVVSVSAMTVAAWAFAFAQYPKIRTELGAAQMARFQRDFPEPAAVYVDQFNLITFFTHYHNWDWHFIGHSTAAPAVSIYRVSRGTRSLLLFRNPSRWNLDPGDRTWYAELAKCIRSQGLPSMAVFYASQQGPGSTIRQESALANQIISLAAAESLCIPKLSILGATVHADFRAGRCDAEIDALKNCSQCDDTSWRINYLGNWSRGIFEGASNATLTYTDDPAASARFSFDGTELQYVYTKAHNRGFAAIYIDGALKGMVDLYSPTIEWQSSTTFGGLEARHHTTEIRVTGRRNPASNASYIDIDELRGR
jgi:4-amino-4-deoxy-L-arabinose transferase-like glycosyltransferase